ncbi:hypothetical protein BH10BAC4_BH10BAC4_05870 [soil metagenome]
MKPLKVAFIIAHVSKSLQLEWMIDSLAKKDIQLSFILLGETETEFHRFLKSRNFEVIAIPLAGRLSMISAFFVVRSVLSRMQPDAVHTHLYHGNIVGLSAAWMLGIKKRIYTRHHGTIHHDNFPKAVFIDRLVNKLATHIILPAKSLYEIVVEREGARPDKIRYVPHGFNLDYFSSQNNEETDRLKKKYNLAKSYPVVGVIARHTEWKGVQYVIPAFIEILSKFPEAHLVLANANGDYHQEILKQLSLIPKDKYTLIGFESETASLYHCFTIFVHLPVDSSCEAFGQTYVEALASGVPSVFTLSGIANEFIQDGVNALVVKYRDSQSAEHAMTRLLNDNGLATELKRQGAISVRKLFAIDEMTRRLEKIYTTGE